MNRCASAVITTRTLHFCFVSRLARSAALCAAIEPVTPRMMFFDNAHVACNVLRQVSRNAADAITAIRRSAVQNSGGLRPRHAHFFRLDNRQHPPQILRNRRADQKIIEILPLRDFLPRDAQPLLDFLRRIRSAFFQPFLQHRDGRRRQKYRHQRAFQFRLGLRPVADGRRALHVHVQQHILAANAICPAVRISKCRNCGQKPSRAR